MSANKLRLALLQLAVRANKAENLDRVSEKIREVAAKGVHMVCLSEDFSFPYNVKFLSEMVEPIPGKTSTMLSHLAQENQVYLVGGSMSESENGKLYTTCLVYGPDGSMLVKHRKLHLFEVNVAGKITVTESDFFTAGDRVTTFDTPFCKVGVGICHDIGYPLLAQVYAQLGCKLLVFPSAFSIMTGRLHWDLLSRCRAVDNQVYVAMVSPARNENASYVTWGHSMLVDPRGEVVQSAGAGEEVVLAEVDLEHLALERKQRPIAKNKRDDLYKVVSCDKRKNKQ